MATESRKPKPSVMELLWRAPYKFSFFQVMRLLRGSRRGGSIGGREGNEARIPLWLRSRATLAFIPSEVLAIEKGGALRELDMKAEAVVTVGFMGVAGHESILPDHYMRFLMELEAEKPKNYSFRDFLDIFNNRLIHMYYEAWEKQRFYVTFERTGDDHLRRILSSLSGELNASGGQERTTLSDAPVFEAGFLQRAPVSAEVITSVLSSRLRDIPFELIQFDGRWVDIDDDSLCRLSDKRGATLLGQSSLLGRRAWDIQGRVRLRLGPLDREAFRAFSPGATRRSQLERWMWRLLGAEIDCEIELIPAQETEQACRLGAHSTHGYRLGVSGWLGPGDKRDNRSTQTPK